MHGARTRVKERRCSQAQPRASTEQRWRRIAMRRVAEVCCGCVELEGARAREIPFAFHHLTFFLVRLMLSRVDSSAFCAMCGEPSEAERIHGVKFTESETRKRTRHRPPPGPRAERAHAPRERRETHIRRPHAVHHNALSPFSHTVTRLHCLHSSRHSLSHGTDSPVLTRPPTVAVLHAYSRDASR